VAQRLSQQALLAARAVGDRRGEGAAHTEAARLVGERTCRVWRFYMSGAARAFATNRNQLIQALYSRTNADGTSEVPLTRADLYR
jgi:hypothetical protein